MQRRYSFVKKKYLWNTHNLPGSKNTKAPGKPWKSMEFVFWQSWVQAPVLPFTNSITLEMLKEEFSEGTNMTMHMEFLIFSMVSHRYLLYIHFISKYLFSDYYMLDIVPSIMVSSVNEKPISGFIKFLIQ